jgi:hypothetical protein
MTPSRSSWYEQRLPLAMAQREQTLQPLEWLRPPALAVRWVNLVAMQEL